MWYKMSLILMYVLNLYFDINNNCRIKNGLIK